MTYPDPQTRLATLLALPPDHPDRAQLETELALLPPAEREHWQALLRESDLLHNTFAATPEMPASFHQSLLTLPSSLPAKPRSRKPLLAIAAALLILIPVAIFYINQGPETPSYYQNNAPLADATAAKLADLALVIHQSPPPLTITSSDPAVVTAALKDNQMPFPTLLLKPTQPVTLIGGGICDFGPTRAIFTRWKSTATPTLTYTLYQFDGKPLDVPATFQRQTAVPSNPGATARVNLWPGYGNPCTWALVLDDPKSPAPFYY